MQIKNRNFHKKSKFNLINTSLFAIGILTILLMILPNSCSFYNKDIVQGIVKEKWVKRIHESDIYLVSVEKKDKTVEVLSIKDDPIMGVWNSGDLFAQLQKGKEYKFQIFGMRNQYLSLYRQIQSFMTVEKISFIYK